MSFIEPQRVGQANVLSYAPMRVKTFDSKGTVLLTATAFVGELSDQQRPILFSNRHVIAGRIPPDDQYMDPLKRQPVRIQIELPPARGTAESIDFDLFDKTPEGYGAPRWLEHPTWRHRADVVGIPISPTSLAGKVAFLPLWERRISSGDHGDPLTVKLEVPDTVRIVGFPMGYSPDDNALPVWVSGTLASEYSVDIDGLPRVLVDSRTRAGMSGSPVLNYPNGSMVVMWRNGQAELMGPVNKGWFNLEGIYSSRLHEQSDLAYVWKTHILREIGEAGIPGELV